MRKISLAFCLIVSLILGGVACDIVPSFPAEPRIEYRSAERFTRFDPLSLSDVDSVSISISFQDGDGDLGYEPNSAPTGEPYSYVVERFRRVNGVFQPVPSPITLSGQITPSLSGERSGPIEGVLNRQFTFSSSTNPAVRDTVKFRIQVVDRAGHASNVVETEPITVLR